MKRAALPSGPAIPPPPPCMGCPLGKSCYSACDLAKEWDARQVRP